MKRILILLITLLVAFLVSVNSWALAPRIEMDRLLLQAKAALDSRNYAQAIESLEKAEKLGGKLPDTFYFHYGKAYAGVGNLEKGSAMIERYLDLSGTSGKFYQEALIEMNNIEAAKKKRDSENEAAIKKRESEIDAARVQYNRDLAAYNRHVRECPDDFASNVSQARQRLQKAENNCTNQWGNFCDGYEEKNGTSSAYGATLERIKARENLERWERTSSSEWCSGRYDEPTIPQLLR